MIDHFYIKVTLGYFPFQVLLIGKSINFLHQVCHDQTPTTKMIAVTKSADSPQDAADVFTDLENAFRGKIDAAYFETSKHLLDVLNKKYSLLDHMQAVRRYLLLGQGDFIRHLMDLLKPELVRPATTLYQHNLTGILETAVRATNAQFDSPEILKRLDVRLLEVSWPCSRVAVSLLEGTSSSWWEGGCCLHGPIVDERAGRDAGHRTRVLATAPGSALWSKSYSFYW